MDDHPRGPEEAKESSDATVIGATRPSADVPDVAPRSGGEPPRRRRRSWVVGCLLALLGAVVGGGVALLLSRGADHRPPLVVPAEVAPAPSNYETRLIFSPTPERPDATPDIIAAESPVIYCFYELRQLSPDAPLAAHWWREGEDLGPLELGDLQRETGADYASGRFSIMPPAGLAAATPASSPSESRAEPNAHQTQGEAHTANAGFPPGIYEVELTSSAQPEVVARASFMALPRAAKILQGGGELGGPPLVRSLQTATGVTDEGKPLNPAAAFDTEVERIYAVFSYAGVPPGAALTVRWFLDDAELEKARAEIPVVTSEGWGHAWLQVGEGTALPVGQYRVAVYLGDENTPLATGGFRVEQGANRPPAEAPQAGVGSRQPSGPSP